jgi:hypothetical protein
MELWMRVFKRDVLFRPKVTDVTLRIATNKNAVEATRVVTALVTLG